MAVETNWNIERGPGMRGWLKGWGRGPGLGEGSEGGFRVCSLGIQVKVAPSVEVKKPGSWRV